MSGALAKLPASGGTTLIDHDFATDQTGNYTGTGSATVAWQSGTSNMLITQGAAWEGAYIQVDNVPAGDVLLTAKGVVTGGGSGDIKIGTTANGEQLGNTDNASGIQFKTGISDETFTVNNASLRTLYFTLRKRGGAAGNTLTVDNFKVEAV